jgi:subtilase family serine protease
VAVDRDPSLDLGVPVLEINGLNDHFALRHRGVNGTGSGGTLYRAADLRNAYLGVASTCQSLDGTGQVVGIVDFATFNLGDVQAYAAAQLPVAGQPPLAPLNVQIVDTEGGNPAPNSAIESTADVELVYAMAPAAQILFFQGSTGITSHLYDILHAMATSNPPLTVASCSLGFGYSENANQAFGRMAVNGGSFFFGSG